MSCDAICIRASMITYMNMNSNTYMKCVFVIGVATFICEIKQKGIHCVPSTGNLNLGLFQVD